MNVVTTLSYLVSFRPGVTRHTFLARKPLNNSHNVKYKFSQFKQIF